LGSFYIIPNKGIPYTQENKSKNIWGVVLAEVFVRWTCHLVWNRDMTYNPGELMGYSRWLKIGQLLDLVIARGYSMVLIGFKLSRFPSCENYSLVSDVSETAFPPRSGMLKGAAGNALR
jgi:hypothetical protein